MRKIGEVTPSISEIIARMSRSSGATINTVPFLLASRAMRATWAYGDACGSNALKDESAWLLNRGGIG